jgi:hypothetical protein
MVPEQRHASWLPTAYSTSVGPGFRFFLNFGMRISGLPGTPRLQATKTNSEQNECRAFAQ